jgi:hypothetical protein
MNGEIELARSFRSRRISRAAPAGLISDCSIALRIDSNEHGQSSVGDLIMGNMGKFHADYLLNNKVNRCELTALCSSTPAKLEKYKALKILIRAKR